MIDDDSMEVKDDGGGGVGDGGGTAAAAAAADDDSMEVNDDGGGGVGDGGGTAAAATDDDDDNNYDNDDDDGNNPSQVPEYRNWLVREWDSESDDSDWVPSVYEVMSEDDAVSSGSDLASVTSDSHSVDSNEAPGDENSANDRPAGVVNIYDLPFHRESLGFDESQMRAFKMALTKRFAVIQGPPGTGKTYVGLKIARVLLQSVTLWQRKEERSPILMVSYTNHALDEFLSGLPMEGIVRVGGRCSDKLKCCSLKVRRDEANAKKKTPRRIATARRNVRQERRELEQDGSLERCITVLRCSRRGILAFHVLKQFMSERHVRWFEKEQTDTYSMDDLLCYWLGVKRVVKDRDARKKHDRDVVDNEDFQMQISGRNFSNEQDFEDDNAKRAMKPSEVSICTTEDSNKSAGCAEISTERTSCLKAKKNIVTTYNNCQHINAGSYTGCGFRKQKSTT
ncbi:NFX1-type zinc finger-containing protein 1 [Desmophyllum pertusum]|uniref:NFX1-type zinc finger-containing protein 1 n=1 Tax=Desmophyllum pertusum TaxID=174260 RepID=A0A9X0CYR9_9CNID|nr:NFX1-type zinc finger-containing protein 1 [Desmophyllum pertusum]